MDSAGRETLFQADVAGDLVSVTDAVGSIRTYAYNTDHLLIEQTGPRGERTEYDYDNGRIVETRSFDVDGTTLLRGRQHIPGVIVGEVGAALASGQGTLANPIPIVEERVDVYVDGRGQTWRDITSADGKEVRFEDALGRATVQIFDDSGLLISRIRPDGSETTSVYDVNGNLTQTTELFDNSTIQIEYNGPFDQISRFVDPRSNQSLFSYDALGNLVSTENAALQTTQLFYEDPAFPNLVTRVVDPLGNTTVRAYDSHGNLASATDPLNRMTSFQYDTGGNLSILTDAGGLATTHTYDALNRLVSTLDAAGGLTQRSYQNGGCACSTGNLTQVTFPNATIMGFAYDGLNRQVGTTDQLGMTSQFILDAEGNLIQSTNRNGEQISLEYDKAGQLIRKELPNNGVTLFGYDLLGNLIFARNDAAQLDFTYDSRSRITQAVQALFVTTAFGQVIGVPHTLDYTYDAAGNRLSMTDATGSTSYVYDVLNRLAQLTNPSNAIWTFAYDALDRRTETHAPNGTITFRSYDAASQISEISHETDIGDVISRIAYTQYDAVGNSTSQALDDGTQILNSSFTYDALSRLDQSTLEGVSGVTLVNPTPTYDAANRLLTDEQFTYTYDTEGRLASKTEPGSPLTEFFDYDAGGRLVAYRQVLDIGSPITVLDARYAYDALGRRVKKSVNGTVQLFIYDGPDILKETTEAGLPLRRYTHGLRVDEPLAVLNNSSMLTSYYHADRLGSILALTDEIASMVQEYAYDAFGVRIAQTNPLLEQPFAFTGRETDLESGLYYYRARYYDPAIGRFISEDPLGIVAGLNLYVYVDSNPVNLIDPDGRDPGADKPSTDKPSIKNGGINFPIGGGTELDLKPKFLGAGFIFKEGNLELKGEIKFDPIGGKSCGGSVTISF